jgi:membrane-bound serine protease (ClpP class)
MRARALVALLLLGLAPGARSASGDEVLRIVIDGSINPATAAYVDEAIVEATTSGAAALLIQMDTPGGLLTSARHMVKALLGAPLPVIVYVAPSGAGAGSAGVFITMAAHVAAMAPGTSIGAAHPVGGQGQDIDGVMGEKMENSTASFAEGIAQRRGRNVEWAEKAVRESVSITASEAAEERVIDFVARDVAELFELAGGREVEVQGKAVTIALPAPEAIRDFAMRLPLEILNVIADPNIAYLLLMAGFWGLVFELRSPGFGVPGVFGAICLILGLTSLHVLSVSYGGLALLLVGLALLLAESFVPSFGLLGIGGIVALVLGSLFLFDEAQTGLAVARELIVGVALGTGLFIAVLMILVIQVHRRRPRLGREGLVGTQGVVTSPLSPRGHVRVNGEIWTAIGEEPLALGAPIEVVDVQGLVVTVRSAQPRNTSGRS